MGKKTTTTTVSGGVGFFGLLFIVLLALKITGAAQLSWFLVFLPIFIPVGILVLLLAGAMLWVLVS